MVVVNTKSCAKTSYMLIEMVVPSVYNERYAIRSKATRILGCPVNNRKVNDRTIGKIPISSFNSFHLINNIAEI